MISSIIRHSRGRYKLLSAIVCLFLIALSVRLASMADASRAARPRAIHSKSPSSKLEILSPTTRVKNPRVNSTLGFEKIMYINLPWRADKDDAMVLQAAISEIELTRMPGVVADETLEQGLGPTTNPDLPPSAKACYRSHMNAWRAIIQNNWQSALILESDAAWDTNVREMMGHFAVGLEHLIHKQGLAPKGAQATTDDPYLAEYWDVIQFSLCGGDRDTHNGETVICYDPYTLPGTSHYGLTLRDNERLVRYGSFGYCTSAYAVSRIGAMKLLQRAVLNMNDHVDQVMAVMSDSPDFRSFITIPDIFIQAAYRWGIGMDDRYSDREPGDTGGDESEEAWEIARQKMSPWVNKDFYDWVWLKKFALWDLKDYLYGDEPREKS